MCLHTYIDQHTLTHTHKDGRRVQEKANWESGERWVRGTSGQQGEVPRALCQVNFSLGVSKCSLPPTHGYLWVETRGSGKKITKNIQSTLYILQSFGGNLWKIDIKNEDTGWLKWIT